MSLLFRGYFATNSDHVLVASVVMAIYGLCVVTNFGLGKLMLPVPFVATT